ncbi:MAG: hypothetical protein ACRC6Z_05800 [Cetobacterium sp.]
MKNFNFIKSTLFIFIIFIFTGCSAIMSSIGNNKIQNSIKTYSINGLTAAGTLNLIAGLNLSPDSLIGISQYQKQYFEISEKKNNLIKQTYFSKNDLEYLNLYLLTIEEFKSIHSKFSTININYNDFNSSKIKITKIFEDFILKDEKIYINRIQKIQKINYYKTLKKYTNSYLINGSISNLERDVTINIYISSSFKGFSKLHFILENSLLYAADNNINRNLGNYVIFKGFSDFISSNSQNYFIDFNFSDIYIRTLETIEETKEENKIFVTKKRVTVSGVYRIYSSNKKYNTKYFDFSENYILKVRKYDDSIFYDDERDIIKNILQEKFSNIIKYDLEDLIF